MSSTGDRSWEADATASALVQSIGRMVKQIWKNAIEPVLLDPETFIVRPLKIFFLDQPGELNYTESLKAALTSEPIKNRTAEACRPTITTAKLCCLLRPNRVIRLTLTAWLLTEGLTAAGALAHDPRLSQNIEQAWKKAKPQLDKVKSRANSWWSALRQAVPDWRRVHTWAPKYQ